MKFLGVLFIFLFVSASFATDLSEGEVYKIKGRALMKKADGWVPFKRTTKNPSQRYSKN